MPVKLLIVDDHEVVIRGIRTLLEDYNEVEVVAEARSGVDALESVKNHKPDVILLDINMPGMSGLQVAEQLNRQKGSTKILLFTMHSDSEYIMTGIKNGVHGYLLKDSGGDEIVKAILEVNKGNKYFPLSVSAILVNSLQTNIEAPKQPQAVLESELAENLSPKETEVLKLIAEGLRSQEIADKLDLSVRTVSNHRANMLRKTSMSNTYELVQAAINEGII